MKFGNHREIVGEVLVCLKKRNKKEALKDRGYESELRGQMDMG